METDYFHGKESLLVIMIAVMLAGSVAVAIAGMVFISPCLLIGGTTFAIVFCFAFLTIISVICDKET